MNAITQASVSLALFTVTELAQRAKVSVGVARRAVRTMLSGRVLIEYGRGDRGHKLYALARLF